MCKVIECSYVQYNNATSLIKLKLAAVNANAVHPSDWPERSEAALRLRLFNEWSNRRSQY